MVAPSPMRPMSSCRPTGPRTPTPIALTPRLSTGPSQRSAAERVASPTSPTARSATPFSHCGADARPRSGAATAPPSPPGSPGARRRRGGPRHRSRPAPNGAARTSTTPGPSAKPRSNGCCHAATSRSANAPCGGCSTKPPPAPLDIEDLDLENRCAPLKSKGGDTKWVYWDAGTAHLLRPPTHRSVLAGRCSCPTAARSPPAVPAPSTSASTPEMPTSRARW